MQRTYTLGEEIWSSSIHGAGIILGIAALAILTSMATYFSTAWGIVSSAIFGASVILLYSASTLYHAITNEKAKRFLKKFDHIAIYYLIAGTYTPFLLVNLRGTLGWTIFGIIWGLALLGTILKLSTKTNGTKLWSISLYLLMGWMIVFAFRNLCHNINTIGLIFLTIGGLCYTGGIVFYIWKSKKYTHAIWHFFVLAGTVMHFFAVLYGCILI
ncbi:MAG: hemolysin III family protein [Alphaproteobacteria bacterium]|nr:hemolysin III family protein [Alphaproteobacteria bacterium]